MTKLSEAEFERQRDELDAAIAEHFDSDVIGESTHGRAREHRGRVFRTMDRSLLWMDGDHLWATVAVDEGSRVVLFEGPVTDGRLPRLGDCRQTIIDKEGGS